MLPTATAGAGFTRCGARNRDNRREATLLLLVVVLSGADVAVWAHARTQNCSFDLWVEGIHITSRDTPTRLRSNQPLTSTVSR